MKKLSMYIKSVMIIGFVFVLFSCGGGDDDGPGGGGVIDPPRTVADVIADFQNLDIQVGINDLVLESLTEGVFWNFRIIVPEGASSTNKRPLVLSLHGGAQANAPDAHKSTECLVEPAFEGKNVFILSPNSNGEYWYAPNNQAQVQALLELSTSNLDIDKTKTVITGFSDGGNGSWFYAQYFENLVAASIPMASSYDSKNGADTAPKINVPLYVIHGSADTWFPLEDTEGFVNESIAAGSDINFVVAEGLIHTAPCDYVDYLKDAVTWLETEIW
jgi:predicted peptidase